VGLRTARSLVIGLVAAACLTPAVVAGAQTPVAVQSPPTADVAVAYQVNSMHDGNLNSGVEVPPLTKAWTRDLGTAVSYPLIVDGKVFVTAPTGTGYNGTSLHVLDAATGADVWGPIDLGGSTLWSALTYGGGKVFTLTYNGILQAFDARTGALEWVVGLPGQYAFSSAPTYRNGLVFVGGAGSGGTVYAVSALDGRVLWRQSVANGDNSSPAVSDTGVYVSYACNQTSAFAPATGAVLWRYSGPCSGGGGKTTVLANNRLWTRDYFGSLILNASTGALVGSHGAEVAPAFDGPVGFFLSGGVLRANNAATQALLWSFSGDGNLSSAPIVVNGYVYVGSTAGHIWALDKTTGLPVWDDSVGAPIARPDEQNVSQPLTGLGAGQGLVVVPASNLLVAYTGASGPTPATATSARGWGVNVLGMVGDGTVVDRHAPVAIPGLAAGADVVGGLLHSLALLDDGTVKAWGWNAHGQLGDGTVVDRSVPVTVSGLTDVVEVAGGALHSLALRADGTVWAWGWNGFGQLGDGTTVNRTTPAPVPGLTDVVAIAAGFHHNLALRSDGSVWAWGFNVVGQVGDGTILNRVTPVPVSGLVGVTSISAGATHSVAVMGDGTVRAWGWNIAGQLGDGTLTEHHVPLPVLGLDHVYRVSAGFHHNLALREDGSVWSWGWNDYGQLGDGTTTTRMTPVRVATSAVVVDVAAGGIHSAGRDENGLVGTWGWNGYGQLGDGTTTDRLMPVPVSGGTTAFDVAAGGYHTLIL
jgi:alpha-tubulin suppressor-like RCC1 family protein/outer membrane protein assembly factor BamB